MRTLSDCETGAYNSNITLQRWILSHLGTLESNNPYTNSRGTISVYQVSKLLNPEILIEINASIEDILCNMLEMKQKGFLKESKPPLDGYYDKDEDMRSFYLTAGGMLEFRKEIQPIAKMMAETEQDKIEKAIENTKGDSSIKRIFLERITSFKNKLGDKLEEEALNLIISIMKENGPKAITFILNLLVTAKVAN